MTRPTLTIKDLSVARGGRVRLAGLTAEVAPGQVLALRGPNGVGKTTLLRTLAGVQPPLRGTVTPGGDDMAYAGHATGIKATLSVAENLQFWAQVYGTQGVEAALSAFGLNALADRPGGTLSAGQARRCGLARLVLSNRVIWLLDEPTVSLDADGVSLLGAALTAHIATGGSAVIATHAELPVETQTLDLVGYVPARSEAGTDAFAEAVE